MTLTYRNLDEFCQWLVLILYKDVRSVVMYLGLAHQNESYVLRAHEIDEVSKYDKGMI